MIWHFVFGVCAVQVCRLSSTLMLIQSMAEQHGSVSDRPQGCELPLRVLNLFMGYASPFSNSWPYRDQTKIKHSPQCVLRPGFFKSKPMHFQTCFQELPDWLCCNVIKPSMTIEVNGTVWIKIRVINAMAFLLHSILPYPVFATKTFIRFRKNHTKSGNKLLKFYSCFQTKIA